LLEKDTSVKHWIKLGRWQTRRLITAARWGSNKLASTPAVLGNAMPKSGSHLIIQVLQGLIKFGPFVNPGFPPVNRTENNLQLADQAVLDRLFRMRPGDIGYGYLKANKKYIVALTRPGICSIFLYRDPRDMIVSHVFYATDMFAGHGMHEYYNEKLETKEDQINAAIGGVSVPGFELRGVHARYKAYIGWLEEPDILCLRFEDLRLDTDNSLSKILDYLELKGFTPEINRDQAVNILRSAINPKKSGTFRKGKPGNWRDHFTQRNIDYFKETTGDLLINLGYEKDNSW
jgi:hypothetical protein